MFVFIAFMNRNPYFNINPSENPQHFNMGDQSIDAEGAPNAKKLKLGEPDENQDAPKVDVVEAEESATQIFKLNIECYEAVADWLSLEDLHSIGRTCKYHQRIAGDIFKKVYPAAQARYFEDGIYIDGVQVNGFCDYIQHLIIGPNGCFRFIESHSFNQLKRINLSHIELTDERIACIKKILQNAEHVELIRCSLDGEFYDKFLQFCKKMKRLTVRPSKSLG